MSYTAWRCTPPFPGGATRSRGGACPPAVGASFRVVQEARVISGSVSPATSASASVTSRRSACGGWTSCDSSFFRPALSGSGRRCTPPFPGGAPHPTRARPSGSSRRQSDRNGDPRGRPRRHDGVARPDGRRRVPAPRCRPRGRPEHGRGHERGASATARTSWPRRRKEPGWQAFLRQYRDLMQLVLVGAAIVSIVALQDVSTGAGRHRPDGGQRRDGPAPGGQGGGERRRAPPDADHDGQRPPRRPGRRGPGRGAGAGRHRQLRGGRQGAGRRPRPGGGDARDRGGGPHRREHAGVQDRRPRPGRGRARSATGSTWPT